MPSIVSSGEPSSTLSARQSSTSVPISVSRTTRIVTKCLLDDPARSTATHSPLFCCSHLTKRLRPASKLVEHGRHGALDGVARHEGVLFIDVLRDERDIDRLVHRHQLQCRQYRFDQLQCPGAGGDSSVGDKTNRLVLPLLRE